MFLVNFALKKPFSVAALVILVGVLGALAAYTMPVDIFPEINIPVVSVVWTYNGMSAEQIQDRILAIHERQMASLVDNVERIEANAYNGVGVIKVYLHEGADVTRAVTQLGSSGQVVMKYMPRNITPPLVLRYGATDVPIIQFSLSSASLTDTKLNDFGQNTIRPALANVQGASVPYPYGGKPRVVMVDLNTHALQASGLSPAQVTDAITAQNVIAPSGDVKMGNNDYTVNLNTSPDIIDAINRFPVKQTADATVFVRDVAFVHDGFQVQTNAVNQNSRPGALMMVRKTGGASTLSVINSVKEALPDIERLLPKDAQGKPLVNIKPIFDQSIFVKAALNSVLMGGLMAAGLTAIMILVFLGNWRLTLIIVASIPLSIIAAVLALYCDGQTLNTMTLGGFALAVGILVDNATVVIENIERNVGLGKELVQAITEGSAEIFMPTLVATLAICIVFVPIFLLHGTPKYLFSPLSLSVILSLLASFVLSFTLVPVLFRYLMKSYLEKHGHGHSAHDIAHRRSSNPFTAIHYGFERGFNAFRRTYRNYLAWAVHSPKLTAAFFILLIGFSCFLFPSLGMDFFPAVDAGQMRLHVRAPAGTKIETTQADFSAVEQEIRRIVGNDQVDVILDNIGLPYSGINIALSDSATVGPMDGEILISLKEHHSPTAKHMAALRNELPRKFPGMQFFFQPADIVNQVLNFGQPAPIDIRVTGPHAKADYAQAKKILADLKKVPGIVDAHIFQVPNAPSFDLTADRTLAGDMGITERDISNNVLVTLSSSAMVAPNFWLSPTNNVSYPLVVQTPTYRVDDMEELESMPVTSAGGRNTQLLMNVTDITRAQSPMMLSQLNIRTVYDINADVQGRDLGSVSDAINAVVKKDMPDAATAMHVNVAGQIVTMRESFSGLFLGILGAIVLVYLLMVMNFQSWLDPLIVLMAVPCALAGVAWMLLLSRTHMSVPALMGSLMCIGLTTANSILVVAFANQRLEAGDDAATAAIAAGYTRLRPVLMTAGAMMLGMIPMALGIGEGGEQNAPLGRAVIGGLLFATFATLIFVPAVYGLMRGGAAEEIVA
ncbi:MAG TPA: efflux RND transporter permease subunit [Tepidisphaeraceae bacterium]|jgi:multidrug efflux pump subunit AcrB|nr:efflux RND transporter permease subunit [Tepidisphaeraceae bacterium]